MARALRRCGNVSIEHLVVDASALIDLVLSEQRGIAVERRIEGTALHAPAHVDAEVLSGLGRIHRAGLLAPSAVIRHLHRIQAAPIERHPLAELVLGAWQRHDNIRLADGLYVELADQLDAPLITTDQRLGRSADIAEVVDG